MDVIRLNCNGAWGYQTDVERARMQAVLRVLRPARSSRRLHRGRVRAVPYLYYDEHTGKRFMGCMNKVFRGEIDVDVFHEAQRTRHGYGGVKMTGLPLPQCKSSVEKAYDGNGHAFECVNPRFFDAPEEDPFAFDLRDAL